MDGGVGTAQDRGCYRLIVLITLLQPILTNDGN